MKNLLYSIYFCIFPDKEDELQEYYENIGRAEREIEDNLNGGY